MKYLQLLLWGLGTLLACEAAAHAINEESVSQDSGRGAVYQAKFKCPSFFGAYPDTTDCAQFYVCMAGISSRKKCGFFMNFCSRRRRCLPKMLAVCATNDDEDKVEETTTTTEATASTTADVKFKCPKFMGVFPHPTDCSKYYNCIVYVPNMKTCPENQLYDAEKSECRPETEVDCGNRQRPDFTTTAIPTVTEPIVTEVPDVKSTEDIITESVTEAISTEEITESTTEAIITEETTESTIEEISTEEITESTTEIISTTKLRPTGPPDHTCDEDDVDCIIRETGDIEEWFICSRDVGSFPHPSSNKLFIFCMNWIPSVKKCGMDMEFSREISTCVETTYYVNPFL